MKNLNLTEDQIVDICKYATIVVFILAVVLIILNY